MQYNIIIIVATYYKAMRVTIRNQTKGTQRMYLKLLRVIQMPLVPLMIDY